MGPDHARRGKARPALPAAPLRMRGQAQQLTLRANWRRGPGAFCAPFARRRHLLLSGTFAERARPSSFPLLSYLCAAAIPLNAVSRRRDPQSRVPSQEGPLRPAQLPRTEETSALPPDPQQ